MVVMWNMANVSYPEMIFKSVGVKIWYSVLCYLYLTRQDMVSTQVYRSFKGQLKRAQLDDFINFVRNKCNDDDFVEFSRKRSLIRFCSTRMTPDVMKGIMDGTIYTYSANDSV